MKPKMNKNIEWRLFAKLDLTCTSENLIRSKRDILKVKVEPWFIVLNAELRTKMVPSFARNVAPLCMRRRAKRERPRRDALGQEKEGLQKNVLVFLMEEKF